MLIGIISDIHANAHALAPVLAVAKKRNVEQLFVLGDLTGYYFNPRQTLDLLDGWPIEIIRGNHEDIFAAFRAGNGAHRQEVRDRLGPCFDTCLRDLSTEEQNRLIGLPATLQVERNGIRFLLCHGSPLGISDYLYPDLPETAFKPFDQEGTDFMFMGHTHRPMVHFGKHTVMINPGSVGQSRVTGGLAQWGIFNTGNRVYTPVSTPYDTRPLKAEIVANGLSEQHFIYEVLDRNK